MKINKLLIILLALGVFISLKSCVEDADFEIPQDLNTIENQEVVRIEAEINNPNGVLDSISVSGLKKVFVPGAATEITSDLVLIGYVSSSDRTGNFFREIFIQDRFESAESGIKVVLNLNDTYNKFNLGRKIYIKLKGLFIGEVRSGDGVITIGRDNGNTVDDIILSDIDDFIFRSVETQTLVPKKIEISDINDASIGTYIQIENAQFLKSLIGENFTDSDERFDTRRTIQSCTTAGSISIETSSFSSFKSSPLPTKSFTINAVVSKTFNGSDIILVLNDKNEIRETGERCDPEVLECTGTVSDSSVIFEENFNNITNERQLDNIGWTNINVSGGSERYERNAFSGNSYLKISAFGTNESPLNAWLVSPAINLDNSTDEELSFQISSNFETGKALEVFVTENYTGDPTTTNWILTDANVPVGDGGFGDFVQSKINISCLSGNIHVAFKYFGADGGIETRYHIDDIKVTGN